jgi:hypothetical protein
MANVRFLIDQAMKLFDAPTLESAKIIANRRKAETLPEAALASAPDDVEASYCLAWGLATDRVPAPDATARIASLCARIVERTRSVAAGAGEPKVEARARAFGLAWGLPERAVAAKSVRDAEHLVAVANEARSLREAPWTSRAVRGAEAGLVFARARERNDAREAYRWLLDWVEGHPLHTSYIAVHDGEDQAQACGLEPFFDDPGFVSWAKQEEAHPAIAPKHRALAVALAAGWDKLKHARNDYEAPHFGRLGRLLALRALGAPLDTRVNREAGAGEWCTVELAAQVSPARLGAHDALGFSLDAGVAGTPPIVALTDWGALDAVEALLAAGADRDAKDAAGQTAVDRAKKEKMARALALFGAKKPKGGVVSSRRRSCGNS